MSPTTIRKILRNYTVKFGTIAFNREEHSIVYTTPPPDFGFTVSERAGFNKSLWRQLGFVTKSNQVATIRKIPLGLPVVARFVGDCWAVFSDSNVPPEKLLANTDALLGKCGIKLTQLDKSRSYSFILASPELDERVNKSTMFCTGIYSPTGSVKDDLVNIAVPRIPRRKVNIDDILYFADIKLIGDRIDKYLAERNTDRVIVTLNRNTMSIRPNTECE